MLRPSELRYLTYTSETLNRFIDKKVYQTAVKLLNPEILEDVTDYDLVGDHVG